MKAKKWKDYKMKYGISIKINVSKIEKARLFEGKNGKYLDITTFIDTENPSEYGDHGFLSQDVSKEEREAGTKGIILGNAKVFYTAESDGQSAPQKAAKMSQNNSVPAGSNDFDDDIPF